MCPVYQRYQQFCMPVKSGIRRGGSDATRGHVIEPLARSEWRGDNRNQENYSRGEQETGKTEV